MMTKKQKEFLSKEKIRLDEYLNKHPSTWQIFNHMIWFAERYKKQIPMPRMLKELKCEKCDFETEKENIAGMKKHISARHLFKNK